ncbi:hypothetical protein [uncultured Microbacterium sp.]|uniref:hypothetical protein n=1 Tax=uncultured Microbacterium sp. TaxID=191216 RepID=UPI0028D1925E|nr:hypothetical protein [uncultured Microbacterium sp.]
MSSDAQTASRVSEMVVPGVGRDAAIANTDPNAPISSTRLQLAGYKVTAYTADEAVIDLAWTVTTSGGALVSYPIALKWSEGDWKVQVADNGQPRFSASPLDSLGGYIPWSGI